MKKQVLKVLTLYLVTLSFLTGCSTGSNKTIATESSKNAEGGFGKVLVVYYSLQGHTREIGNIIKDMTGGDVFEIQPLENYYRSDIEEVGKKQVSEGYKPKLKNSVSNIDEYDLIFIGSPVWWFSVSPPVMSFLSQYDFKDKKVVPYCTYGSDYGDFFNMFEKACPGAKVLPGNDFTNNESKDMEKVKEKIKLWLKNLSN